MGKKKRCSKKPPLPPYDPNSRFTYSTDSKINQICRRVFHTQQFGHYEKALEMVRECILTEQDSAELHCMEAYLHVLQCRKVQAGTNKEMMHFNDLIQSCELAFALMPNSLEIALVISHFLYKLSVMNNNNWDRVIHACNRALMIENPCDMLLANPVNMIFLECCEPKVVEIFNKEKKISGMKENIYELLKKSQEAMEKKKEEGLKHDQMGKAEGEEKGGGIKNDATAMKALEEKEENMGLHMIVQCLWHLREFREEFMNRCHTFHKHIGHPCIICSLRDIFEALSIAFEHNHEFVPLTTASLRSALIVKKVEMKDASELVQVILECVHQSFDFPSEDKYEGSFDCFAGCFVHRIFGMDHYLHVPCIKCAAESGHRKYTSFSITVNADDLRNMKAQLNGRSTCGNCGQTNDIHHTLRVLPRVVTIVIDWQRHDERVGEMIAALSDISVELDISNIFQSCKPNIYFVVSMVCCSSDRPDYISFVYSQLLEKYVGYDGRTDQVIGSWTDVVSTCNKMHLKPKIVFYLQKSNKYYGITVKDMSFKEALEDLTSTEEARSWLKPLSVIGREEHVLGAFQR